MKVGFCGLGRLGLPLAVSAAYRGHDVVGFDVDPGLREYRVYPHKEEGPEGCSFQFAFEQVCKGRASISPNLIFAGTIAELVSKVDLIFVVVQTPHGSQYEGVTRLPDTRSDFDYSYLVRAIREIAMHVQWLQTVAVVSTVLPGTMRREVIPLLKGKCAFAYNPAFPAMGTAIQDYLKPEFVLIGTNDSITTLHMEQYYRQLVPNVRVLRMSVESAELAKVAYNCSISNRISMVNAFMEVCHKVPGCNIDDVSSVLKGATNRIVAPAYFDGGVSDGGACLRGDTLVNTEFAPLPIRYLADQRPEVQVWTYDFDERKVKLSKAVSVRKTGTDKKLVRVHHGGGHIDVTLDHKMRKKQRYHPGSKYPIGEELSVEAQDLNYMDELQGIHFDGNNKGYETHWTVRSVELLPGRHDVYCLTVPENGWFFANNVLVHNCHPRDNIAMSWLAREISLSYDPFAQAMVGRQEQAWWLANLAMTEAKKRMLPLVLLGKAYKPQTNITTGSAGLLTAELLHERRCAFFHYDPYVDNTKPPFMFSRPYCFLLLTKHDLFASYPYPKDSVVIDPFRMVREREGIEIIQVGVGQS